MEQKKDFYSIDDLVTLLGVTRQTITKEIRLGRLEAFKIGPQYRISREALEQYIGHKQGKVTCNV